MYSNHVMHDQPIVLNPCLEATITFHLHRMQANHDLLQLQRWGELQGAE